MSAFVVVVHFDGSPVDLELTRDLARIVAYRGPDASGAKVAGNVAMAHHSMQSMRTCRTDAQPMVAGDGQSLIVCDARLDQRTSLVRALRDNGVSVAPDSPNSRLLLEAFALWGEDALSRISGDYSLVFVDSRRGRLMAAVDPFGLRRLYHGSFSGGMVISNDPLPIMAHPNVDLGLDRLALADFLLTGWVSGVDRTLTPFRSIRELAEGHRLVLGLDSGAIDIGRHWQFPLQDKALYYRSLADYGEHFRGVLKEAIRDRIDAPSVVAPMSGGMDSTTVVALAAEVMREGAGPDCFTAVTAVQHDEDPEGLLAVDVCQMLGVQHHRIEARPGRPLESWTCSPFPCASFFSVYENNQRVASRFGRLSINASSADYALCPERFSIVGQLRATGLRDTWRALRLVKSRYGFRPRLGTGLYSRLRGSRQANPYTRPAYPYPAWLSPDLEGELGLRDRWEAHWSYWPSPEHPLRPTAHRMITGRGRLSMHSVGWPLDFALPDPADPFVDQRVIEFLWSLPPLPWFYDKHLTRTAMRGRLPESVIRRPKAPARRWLPKVGEEGVDFSWQPGRLISELLDVSKLPDLNSGGVSAVDFHPMFLNKWLLAFEGSIHGKLGKRAALGVV